MEGESVAGIAMPEGDPGAVRDAAQQLRRVAGGFDNVASTVQDAVMSVPDWDGYAALEFNRTCIDYQHAAARADGACEDAAHALDVYGEHLARARRRVHRMQEEGKQLETEERNALAAADEARGRLRGAQVSLKLSAMDAAVDGGAAMDAARADVDRAMGDITTATGRATKARERLDQLIRDAREIREQVEDDGRTAAGKVRGAADGMPSVPGAPSGSTGGTPLTSSTDTFGMSVTIVVIHLGGQTVVIKEHTADGKWRVTVIDGWEGGVEFDPAPGAGVDGGRVGRLGAGADVQAAFLAQFKSGKTYEFDDEALADRFIEYEPKYVPDDARQITPPGGYLGPNELSAFTTARLYDRWQDRQKPVEEYKEGGTKAGGSFSFAGTVDGSASAEDILGRKVDTKTGTSTVYMRTSVDLAGKVGYGAEVGGHLKGEAITAQSFDRSGRMSAYSVTVTGTAEGHSGLAGSPGTEKASAGLSHHESEGVRVERQMTLDLNDPQNREAVEGYVQSGGTDPVASAQLADRLAHDARVDVRTYDIGSSKSGADVDVKVFKIDGSRTVEETQLQSMRHSQPGGPRIETVP
jgi:hypothetical protein